MHVYPNNKRMTQRAFRRPLSTLTCMAMIGLALMVQTFRADATNWQANIKSGSDIVMNDLCWPEWDAGTYYCFWYMSFYPKYSSLYGGVAVHGPDKTPALSDTHRIDGDSGALALNAGISCLLPAVGEDNTLYLCNRHGVFKTADRGKSYKLVLRTAEK